MMALGRREWLYTDGISREKRQEGRLLQKYGGVISL